jgi:nucleoid DNA-binding protein
MSREKFEATAKATKVAMQKAHKTAETAITKLIATYAEQGEHILVSGLSANGWAWLAEHTADEEAQAKAIAKEDGKRAQPTRLNTYQRALNIAKKVSESGKKTPELIKEFAETLDDGVEVTLTEFAKWCIDDANKREPRAPLGELEKFLKACRHAVPELGTDECLRILGQAIDELG